MAVAGWSALWQSKRCGAVCKVLCRAPSKPPSKKPPFVAEGRAPFWVWQHSLGHVDWMEMIRIGSKWWMERLIRTDSNWEKWIWSRSWPNAKVMGLLGRCDEPSQGNSSSERSRKNRWRLGETAGLRFPQILNRWYVWNYMIIWPLWLITWYI